MLATYVHNILRYNIKRIVIYLESYYIEYYLMIWLPPVVDLLCELENKIICSSLDTMLCHDYIPKVYWYFKLFDLVNSSLILKGYMCSFITRSNMMHHLLYFNIKFQKHFEYSAKFQLKVTFIFWTCGHEPIGLVEAPNRQKSMLESIHI